MNLHHHTPTSVRINQKLKRELGTEILHALADEDVIEIMLNEDGHLWIEYFSKGMIHAGEMAYAKAESFLNTVASCLNTVINSQNPILEGSLPLDGSRIAGTVPPISTLPTFAIRKKLNQIFTLDAYVGQNIMTAIHRKMIHNAVKNRKNILVAGGTGSGKTTLTNAIIHEITDLYPQERMVIIEDTPEIQCSAKNSNKFLTSVEITAQKLLRLTLRYRPDRILFGEVRGREALDLLKAWNTGHPGGVSTLHANSAQAALLRMEQCISEAIPHRDMRPLIGEAIDIIIFITKLPQGRRIKDIIEVQGFQNNHYLIS